MRDSYLSKNKSNMIAIELFCGAGGLSLGAHWAGIDVAIAVEQDHHAAQTFKTNFPETNVITDDIKNIEHFNINTDSPTVLFGGPPCQGYSSSNQRNRTSKNPINWLFLEFLRCVKLLEPNWVVIENVKGLTQLKKGYFIKKILQGLSDLGYLASYKVLNAKNYGVPQKRERVFIVASSQKIKFEFPDALEMEPVTVQNAISDLPNLKNGNTNCKLSYSTFANCEYQRAMRGSKKEVSNNLVTKNSDLILERYKHIPQGGNWKDIPDELMSNYKDHKRCHHGIYRRLLENEPASVIGNFRKNMLIHPTQNRGLSVREAARLQSFPDWFEFSGPLISQQQHVGNAVPPLLSKAVFNRIIEMS